MKTNDSPLTETPVFLIDGNKATTWDQVVHSINSFIPDSTWQGNSLDALDDILYGGYGTPNRFILIWKHSKISRKALNYEATEEYYEKVPNFRDLYESGNIKTLFDTLVEIFRAHDNIELRLE